MDIRSLKLELMQKLMMLNDERILTSTKKYLDTLMSRSSGMEDDREKALLAAAQLFGQNAYGDDEPDISHLELKEPNPKYGG